MAKSFQLQWSIEGDKELSRVLQGVSSKIKNLKRPFTDAADHLVKTFSTEVFDTQGAIIDMKWKRLSPRTVAMKARRGYPADPLIATGRMKSSFKSVVSSDHAIISNDTDYFKYHQSNTTRTGNLPRRPMMKLAERQKQQVVKIFQLYLQEVIKG